MRVGSGGAVRAGSGGAVRCSEWRVKGPSAMGVGGSVIEPLD